MNFLLLRTDGARLEEVMSQEGLTRTEGIENIPIGAVTEMIATILDVSVAIVIAMKTTIMILATEVVGVVGEVTKEVGVEVIVIKAIITSGVVAEVTTEEEGGVITIEGATRILTVGVEVEKEKTIIEGVDGIIVEATERIIAVEEGGEITAVVVEMTMEGVVGGGTTGEGGVTGVAMKEVEEGAMGGKITMKAMDTVVGGVAVGMCVAEEEVGVVGTKMIILIMVVMSIMKNTTPKTKGRLALTSTVSRIMTMERKIMRVTSIMKIILPKRKVVLTASKTMTVARRATVGEEEPTVTVAGTTMKMKGPIGRGLLIARSHIATASRPRCLDPVPGPQTVRILIPV